MNVYPITYADAERLLRFENRRYHGLLYEGSPRTFLRQLRFRLLEICCYDGSKLIYSDGKYSYYQY